MRLPVTLCLQPSRWLWRVLLLAHAVAAFSILLLNFPLVLKVPASLLIGCSMWLTQRSLNSQRFKNLVLRHDGQVDLVPEVGAGRTAMVLPGTTQLRGLIVMRLEGGESLALLADSASAADWRRLRVWLSGKASQ